MDSNEARVGIGYTMKDGTEVFVTHPKVNDGDPTAGIITDHVFDSCKLTDYRVRYPNRRGSLSELWVKPDVVMPIHPDCDDELLHHDKDDVVEVISHAGSWTTVPIGLGVVISAYDEADDSYKVWDEDTGNTVGWMSACDLSPPSSKKSSAFRTMGGAIITAVGGAIITAVQGESSQKLSKLSIEEIRRKLHEYNNTSERTNMSHGLDHIVDHIELLRPPEPSEALLSDTIVPEDPPEVIADSSLSQIDEPPPVNEWWEDLITKR